MALKNLWQIWAAFGLCLVIVLTGLVWLTVRAMDLDRAEVLARREAESARRHTHLQERIAMALWRMDWMLAPLIAQEATRPSFFYRPFLPSPAGKGMKGNRADLASPLLTQPPRYVVLNFDVSAGGHWTSPQSPSEADVPMALAAGISRSALTDSLEHLAQLRDSISYQQLLDILPDSFLPLASFAQQQPGTTTGDSDSSIAVLNGFAQQGDFPQTLSPRQMEQSGSPQGPSVVVDAPNQQAEYAAARQPPSQPPAQMAQAGPPNQTADEYYRTAQTRDQREWLRRNRGMQSVAHQQMLSNSAFLPADPLEREGVSRPIWIGSKLILARRVVSDGDVRIQGCWLDWSKIRSRLKQEVVDLFPEIDLVPVVNGETVPPGRLLATLPVQLSMPSSVTTDLSHHTAEGTSSLSAIRISLMIAWCCLLLGCLAVAMMLRSVLALSERRASFVSAVTHELRSPLTTFRMYAEMLAEGMVRDEAQRVRYLATLRAEADRLAHLVDNVLQYARLERGRRTRPRVEMDLKTLMQQTTERLPQRARQAGMELHETIAPQDAKQVVLTDPRAVEQILFNLVDNSCKYAAGADDRRIHLHWSLGNRVLQVRVTDHGPGIQPAQRKKLFRPFSKSDQEAAQSAPGIGLGLALCRRLASEIGGRLHYDPGDGDGAAFLLELPLAGPRQKRHR